MVSWIRIEIFGWNGFNWIRIRNTGLQRTWDDVEVVELEAGDTVSVRAEGDQPLTSLQVPDLSSMVVKFLRIFLQFSKKKNFVLLKSFKNLTENFNFWKQFL